MESAIQNEIKLINGIIWAAIQHGGDLGWAYYRDWESLETAIGAWLDYRGLSDVYTPSSDADGIVPIKKAFFSDKDEKYIWTLWIPAIDTKGNPISAVQLWNNICKEGCIRIGLESNTNCVAEERKNFPFHIEHIKKSLAFL